MAIGEDGKSDKDHVYADLLTNPNRISLIGRYSMVTSFDALVRGTELRRDFGFESFNRLREQVGVVRRDGLGVLAIIDKVPLTQYDGPDMAHTIPHFLDTVGITNSRTVFIPISPHTLEDERLQEAGFTEIVDISDFPYTPSLIFSAGIEALRRQTQALAAELSTQQTE